MNEFGKFVRSPFHNESEKMIKLYDFIKKYFPDLTDKNFTKENIYNGLYGNVKYEDKKMRDRCSDMLKLAEEYLAIKHLKDDEFTFKRFSLIELLDRKLEVHFDKKYKEIKKIITDSKMADNEGSFFDEHLLSIAYNMFYQYKHPMGKRNNFFNGVSEELELLFKYFSIQVMRYYAFANHLKGFINIDFNYDFYDAVMDYVEKKDLRRYPLIDALWYILKIHDDNRKDEKLYEGLKNLYNKNYKLFIEKDRIMILTELYNFSWTKSIIPGSRFIKERFEIIKLQIEHDVYAKQDGWMQREQYTTVIKAASVVKEFDWVEKFIDNYTIKVVPEFREDAYLWAKAFLYYSQEKYEAALNIIGKTKNGDYIFYVNIKTLLIKILFELNEYERIFTTIDSFKHFLNSNTFIPDHIKERTLNFLNFAYRITMMNINNEKDEYKISKLADEINNCPKNELSDYNWLLEKITKLKIG